MRKELGVSPEGLGFRVDVERFSKLGLPFGKSYKGHVEKCRV